jgi:hypothetical protein
MAPGLGQPDIPGALVVEMGDVAATEVGGLAPSAIINQPNTFTLSTTFTIKDTFAPLLDGEKFDVQHHVMRLEDGNNVKLAGGTVTASVAGGQIVMPYTSAPFTTGDTGSGSQLEIPAGESEGNFRVLTQLVAQNPNVRRIVSAFQDGLLLQVIK